MSYDAVFWDVGGVLVDLASVREGYAAFLSKFAERHDLAFEAAVETWKSALGDHFRSREGTEYRSAREGYVAATDALFDGDGPAVSSWWPLFERATAETMRPEPGAVAAVEALDDAGLYLGIVSDIDEREAANLLDAFDLRGRFDHVTTSEAVGYTKPDPEMFEAAIDAWGGDPAAGLMVGDRYEHDVVGATDAGLDAVAYGEAAAGDRADYVVDDLAEVPEIATGGGRSPR